MIKKNLIKTSLITMTALTLALGMTACGSKKNTTVNTDNTATTKAVVQEQTSQTEAVTSESTSEETSTESATEKTTEEAIEVAVNDTQEDINTEAPVETPVEEPVYADTPEPQPDTSNTNTGSSNTGNAFYDDYMNGAHMVGDENLIDKDSDPSKPCPYPLNTPIEGIYSGIDGSNGVYGDYPVYIVYDLDSEDPTGGKARHFIINNYYGGQSKVNGERVKAYDSLVIGEYDCGYVRATYVSRY